MNCGIYPKKAPEKCQALFDSSQYPDLLRIIFKKCAIQEALPTSMERLFSSCRLPETSILPEPYKAPNIPGCVFHLFGFGGTGPRDSPISNSDNNI